MPDAIEVIIEIPKGSRNKYEVDEATGQIRLNRLLHPSLHYPADYGFIEGTRGGDGDALDVLVLIGEPTFPGCRISARPIGVLAMSDEHGEDSKIIAVPDTDPRLQEVHDIADVQRDRLQEIETFFASYKSPEGKPVALARFEGGELRPIRVLNL